MPTQRHSAIGCPAAAVEENYTSPQGKQQQKGQVHLQGEHGLDGVVDIAEGEKRVTSGNNIISGCYHLVPEPLLLLVVVVVYLLLLHHDRATALLLAEVLQLVLPLAQPLLLLPLLVAQQLLVWVLYLLVQLVLVAGCVDGGGHGGGCGR